MGPSAVIRIVSVNRNSSALQYGLDFGEQRTHCRSETTDLHERQAEICPTERNTEYEKREASCSDIFGTCAAATAARKAPRAYYWATVPGRPLTRRDDVAVYVDICAIPMMTRKVRCLTRIIDEKLRCCSRRNRGRLERVGASSAIALLFQEEPRAVGTRRCFIFHR